MLRSSFVSARIASQINSMRRDMLNIEGARNMRNKVCEAIGIPPPK